MKLFIGISPIKADCLQAERRRVVASKFKIIVHRNDENIHLKLSGDFDGSSAFELLKSLRLYCQTESRAFIHTGSLKEIYPFGRHILQKNLDMLNGKCLPLVFTGEHADQLAPEGSRIF
jgi:hypothetical protein